MKPSARKLKIQPKPGKRIVKGVVRKWKRIQEILAGIDLSPVRILISIAANCGIAVREVCAEWNRDKAAQKAAALAYYAMFSITPMLIIAIAIAGSLFGEEAAKGQIVGYIQGLVGNKGAQFVETALKNANQTNMLSGSRPALSSLLVLVIAATGMFAQLQDSLNSIWKVTPKSRGMVTSILLKRFYSFLVVIGLSFVIIASLTLHAVMRTVSFYVENAIFGESLWWLEVSLELINFMVSYGLATLLFAVTYKYIPDVKIKWSDVWIGAALTSILFTLGKFLFSLYIQHSSFTSVYGAAGSLAVVLVWVYYSAQILFLGAEFTKVFAWRWGSLAIANLSHNLDELGEIEDSYEEPGS
ncbi:ribonuclease BN [Thalassoporum mexicanum PCC 7367]|uniref:YihY/virulence factor BrkB family protein n=1 Tax=Thalassoporum mexicanum TaxID=3457544 RepID=UPI00029FC29F|nr:YihY/virulence factor BrkB family protein [Pseudanabaena sp. PCC 7367]AFY68675.1 ribonuclease BN [Pseudanabaena sp. PCC 7367]